MTMREVIESWSDARSKLLDRISKESDPETVNSVMMILIEKDLHIIAQSLAVIADKGEDGNGK